MLLRNMYLAPKRMQRLLKTKKKKMGGPCIQSQNIYGWINIE